MATSQSGVRTAPSDASGVNASKIDLTAVKVWVFELCKKTHSMGKLIIDGKETNDGDLPYPPYVGIKNPVLLYDPITKNPRTARLIEGVRTFWEDEQEKLPQSQKDSPWAAAFKDGFMFLRTPQDSLKVEWLLMHDEYEGTQIRISQKPPKFKLASKESQAVDDYDFLEKKQKAFTLAIQAETDPMMAHAKYLGVKFTDVHGRALSEKAIRVAYIRKAENDPITFIKSYDNPLTKAAFLVSEAITSGKITMSHVNGQAHWEDTKALILILDADKKPIDTLAQYALTAKGADFLKRISKND